MWSRQCWYLSPNRAPDRPSMLVPGKPLNSQDTFVQVLLHSGPDDVPDRVQVNKHGVYEAPPVKGGSRCILTFVLYLLPPPSCHLTLQCYLLPFCGPSMTAYCFLIFYMIIPLLGTSFSIFFASHSSFKIHVQFYLLHWALISFLARCWLVALMILSPLYLSFGF